ncbi:HEAT repeat domain-containing protein [Paenibacillus sp. OV219]|uniref:HEAT repeat domain-containing protein n=1 Tax=Paenibacillus sp. OV219 TaxID=1884377 RepID=UPI0008C9DF34|nr:HEAT repeat domain-containing protein [Paenibacillus sp. OV219]SEP13723.1 HEAT repeat-containing protein [Paenibacillus sp. OV219]
MEHTEEVEVVESGAPSIEELKKSSSRMSNWRARLTAVEELGKLGGQQAIDQLSRMAKGDTVHQVQAAAHRALRELGEELELPARKTGELVKGVNKILLRIKKSLPEGHSFEAFKEKLQKMRSDVYDTYEGDKEAGFDQWLEQTWASLTRK